MRSTAVLLLTLVVGILLGWSGNRVLRSPSAPRPDQPLPEQLPVAQPPLNSAKSGEQPNTYQFTELTTLADQFGTDKGTKYHFYTDFYDRFFYPVKYSTSRFFEIGIQDGYSLRMLHAYFPNATVFGADIEDKADLFPNDKAIKTFVADQSKRDQLEKFIAANGSDYDFILDDGGHTMDQQQISFGYLFRHVRPGGYYILEDIHTSFLPEFGVDADGANTTYLMIDRYIRTKQIVSGYMKGEEEQYITAHIDWLALYVKHPHSITCVFQKK
jgi:hypothetical protein